ncbi:inactive serine/threonine-protein kinase 19-like [Rhopilema esculentum]|uniref:inactive serine/threonine-protein kinase 19-like n=1 Tax=Rhopilema esculentum TaxID=499914 RepID=UPI0031E13551
MSAMLRGSLSGIGKPRKRKFNDSFLTEITLEPLPEIPNDTKAVLDHLTQMFPREKFAFKLPPIVMKHQLYSILEDKTVVDRELNSLRDNGSIRFFKLDSGTDEFAIIYTQDYVDHVKACAGARGHGENPLVQKFLTSVLPEIKDVSIQKEKTKEVILNDQMVTVLVNLGVLNVRDVKSWWISIPGSALFMKSLFAGRKAVLSLIRKRKFKEIFEMELEQRNINYHSKLGMKYHIHDLIGADLLTRVPTTGGVILRYTGADTKRARTKKVTSKSIL